MAMYLDAIEIDDYCQMIPVDENHVRYASAMIDAYIGTNKGKSKFESNEYTELVKPNRKNICKLKYDPVIDVKHVEGMVVRDINESGVLIEPYLYDFDENGYLIFHAANHRQMTYHSLFTSGVKWYKVTYDYGYDEIPEEVKIACAMLAMNISQVSTFTSLDSMTTLDARFSLADPSLFTSEIKSLLSRYRA